MNKLANTVIDAGAGCGKTFQIQTDICRGLESGQFEIDNLVAITYTRKAAAELKERIINEIRKRADSDEKMLRQLLKIGNAKISTIHSFCESLVKERPVEAGVDPAFEILDESQQHTFFNNTYDRWLAEKVDKNPDLLETLCVRHGLPLRQNEIAYEHGTDNSMQSTMKFILEHRELKLFVPEEPGESRQNIIGEFIRKLTDLASDPNTPEKIAEKIAECLGDVRALQTMDDKLIAESIASLKLSLRTSGGADAKELRDEINNEFGEFKKQLQLKVHFPDIKELYSAFNTLVLDLIEYYRHEMRLAGKMDFTEILICTEKMLRESQTAREYFKKKFKYIFIDEFQDTDPLQARIFFYLAEKEGDFAEKFEDVRLAPDKICVVGDPKQSIYGFRRADIETYTNVSKIIEQSGCRKDLEKNFRSADNILNWVNTFFESRFDGDTNPHQATYKHISIADKQDRVKGNSPNKDLDGKGKVILVSPQFPPSGPDEESETLSADEIREIDAKCTAKWISDNCGALGGPGKILVLFRKQKNMEKTSDYLSELGIPNKVENGASFFKRQEIREMAAFLRAVVDSSDVVALLAALRGPFFGFTDADLCEWRMMSDCHSFRISQNAVDKFDQSHPVSRALAEIHELSERSRTESLRSILDDTVKDRKILISYQMSWEGKKKVRNIVAFIEYLSSLDPLPSIEALDNLLASLDASQGLNPQTDDDKDSECVELMTIHKAKGLQRQVVYLADTAGIETTTKPPAYADVKSGRLFFSLKSQILNDAKVPDPPETVEHEKINKLRECCEAERLRYVAATRAIETLVINTFPSKRRNKKADNIFLEPFANANASEHHTADISTLKLSFNIPKRNPRSHNTSDFNSEWETIHTTLKNSIEEISKPLMRIVKPSAAPATPDSTPSVEILYDPVEYQFKISPGTHANVGTLVHKLLELSPDNPETTAKALLKTLKSNIPTKLLIERYNAINKQICEIRKDATRELREVPIKYQDNDGSSYDGVIDLLIEKNGIWHIIDYKILSAEYPDEKINQKYSLQLDAYRRGLEKAGLKTNKPIIIRA